MSPALVPPYCAPRSAGFLQAVIQSKQVETHYLSIGGVTHCGEFVRDVLSDLSVPFPRPVMYANEQIDWLASPAGVAAGWAPCGSTAAIDFANEGRPVVCTYRNPIVPPAGHSHIAMVTPSKSGGVVHVAQAGAQNFSDKPLGFGFGTLPVKFFSHL